MIRFNCVIKKAQSSGREIKCSLAWFTTLALLEVPDGIQKHVKEADQVSGASHVLRVELHTGGTRHRRHLIMQDQVLRNNS